MTATIHGLHHITAILGDSARARQFFATTLGLRLVKQSVNLDDVTSHHLFFGDEIGRPGSLMTILPRQSHQPGRIGAGQATIAQLSVPEGALSFWRQRLRRNKCNHIVDETLFGDNRALFQLPDGLLLALVECAKDDRTPWTTDDIDSSVAIRGLYGVTLAQQSTAHLPALLTGTFGYIESEVEDIGSARQCRFILPNSKAGVIDVQIDPNLTRGHEGVGTIHHIAFEVESAAHQEQMRQSLIDAGMLATDVIDRHYFNSVYARTAGGILIGIAATKGPGFTIDEAHDNLGDRLCLPPNIEHQRKDIESALPPLDGPDL